MSRHIKMSFLLIVFACLSATLMLRTIPHQKLASQPQGKSIPDAYMQDVSYYQYDEQGLLHGHLTASFITHYPQHNASQFLHPHYRIYTDKRVPWTITAHYGKSQNGIHQIFLWDNVKVHEPQQPTEPETTITTSALTLFPRQSFAKTNQAVTITREASTLNAIGMTANLKTGTLHLLSHSHGIYEAPPPNKKPIIWGTNSIYNLKNQKGGHR